MGRRLKAKKMPLSTLDKSVYTIWILLFFFGDLAILFVYLLSAPAVTAFRDPSVIAHTTKMWSLACLPLTTVLFIPCVLLCRGVDMRQPLFGNKKFKQKWGEAIIKTTPLFSEAFRNSLTAKKRAKMKRNALIFLAALLVSTVIAFLGLFPRTTLDDKDTITDFNCFNQITATHHVEDAEHIRFYIEKHISRHGTTSYTLNMELIIGEEEYIFYHTGFREKNTAQAFEHMLYLKSLFDEDKCEIGGTDKMALLIDDRNYTPEETALLYELLEYTD